MPQYEEDELPPPALPDWQGPELAIAQVHDALEQIRFALQPPRLDIIDRAAHDALKALHMLRLFWEGQPPGAFSRERRRR